MLLSSCCNAVRRLYAELDYTRHFPKPYVNRMKRTVPKKIYDNRYGAPPIIHWTLPPDDSVPNTMRPWEIKELNKTMEREKLYLSKKLIGKFFRKHLNLTKRIPDTEWTFFPGDIVQVLIGADKGKKGFISHVIRDANAVFVDGLHTKLVEMSGLEQYGMNAMLNVELQPLFVDKKQVMLVDPNDDEPCTAKWMLNDAKTDYIRVSERTGYEIPLPSQAFITYEYMSPENYIEVPGKDTPAKDALEKTYDPQLCTFEGELEKEYNLKSSADSKPTYWY